MSKDRIKLSVFPSSLEGSGLPVVATCILKHQDKLLMVQRAKDPFKEKWCFPGGKVEKKESVVDGLCREILEEVGMNLDREKLLEINNYLIEYGEFRYLMAVFCSNIQSIDPEVFLSDEHLGYEWASLDILKTMDLIDGEREIIEDYKRISGVYDA